MRSIILFCFLTIISSPSIGQNLRVPALSPYSEIKQNVGLTEITIQYSRPSKKGRYIMGDLVPYDKIWRTGANASTKLIFKDDVRIAGNDLPAGTYALYTIPGKQNWTVIIHRNTELRSLAGDAYKQANDAFRFEVPSIQNPFTEETFNIRIGDITSHSCNLILSWDNTIIKFPIEVEVKSKIQAQMEELLKDPENMSSRNYFRAAEYYFSNNIDLDQSMEWINAALMKSENNFRYGLLKAKIYGGLGEWEKALETVKLAHEWAWAANNANYIEQTKLYWDRLRVRE